ncbi:NAD(P)-dependent oxidoreductase [Arthrobacter castelli]|uniref:NAD(P)-dependent oxidoreductase n=1 Tax=Arthrobacter castelli TaxID=271431 RepID=UPI000402D77F|nr:NAD(P)H-binding protein [Arthrobacter castelli]
MKIGIIGATGNAGSALFAEAAKRGHQTTAIARNPARAAEVLGDDAAILERDAFDLTAEDLAGFDVVVNAFGAAPDQAHLHVDLTQSLVDQGRGEHAPRLVFILGAGSLTTGGDNHLFVEDLRNLPGAEAWVSIPENQLKQLEQLRTVTEVDWVGVSPSAQFTPGEATKPTLGGDALLYAPDGESHTTTGTMAVAILDEIEEPAHRLTRFTVSDS